MDERQAGRCGANRARRRADGVDLYVVAVTTVIRDPERNRRELEQGPFRQVGERALHRIGSVVIDQCQCRAGLEPERGVLHQAEVAGELNSAMDDQFVGPAGRGEEVDGGAGTQIESADGQGFIGRRSRRRAGVDVAAVDLHQGGCAGALKRTVVLNNHRADAVAVENHIGRDIGRSGVTVDCCR